MRAEHNDGVTLWLLLAVMNDLLSLAGESRMSSMLSSADSVLQQVDLTETMRSVLMLQPKVASYLESAAIT